MSYNGSGVFNINTAGQPVVTGTVISSTAFNALTADLGTGLSTAITKDGQTVATARIPFAQGINSSLVTDATSTTTGSIITAGGVGIAKALFVGTTANIAGTTTLAGVTATSITDSGLTSGRVTYAGTAGLLQDSANLTFSGSALAVTGTLSSTTGANFATSSGNVGIGTTGPDTKLTIKQSMNVFGGSTYAAASATGQGLNFGYDGNTERSWIQALRNNTSELRELQLNPLGGTVTTGAALTVGGALSKASGSFRIEHPLPSKSATHQLVHSFIEGPKCDLIYRGKVHLVDGRASVNIDIDSTMTEGTFEVLCRNVQCFTSNESGWGAIRGKVIGNILTIEAQDSVSTDNVSWMVIGERKDPHIMETEWTDDNGKVIVEPLKH